MPIVFRKMARPAGETALTLVAAAAGGIAFSALGLPAAWLSGALVVVTAMALAGLPVRVPDWLRRLTFLMLGTSIGAAVTPATIASVWTWPITMAALVISIPAVMVAVVAYLRYARAWDVETAFYASAPGSLSAVVATADAAGVDVRKVAFAQSVRVFILVAGLPSLLTALQLAGNDNNIPIGSADFGPSLIILIATGFLGGWLADRAGVPGGLIVGSMIASAILRGTGLVDAQVPTYIQTPNFVVLGAFIGARFVGTELAMLRRWSLDAIGSFAVAMAVTTGIAAVASALAGEGLAKTILAFAPGGLEAMAILAFLMQLDPAFVGAHHIVRFVAIALLLPLAARLMFGRPRRVRASQPPRADGAAGVD